MPYEYYFEDEDGEVFNNDVLEPRIMTNLFEVELDGREATCTIVNDMRDMARVLFFDCDAELTVAEDDSESVDIDALQNPIKAERVHRSSPYTREVGSVGISKLMVVRYLDPLTIQTLRDGTTYFPQLFAHPN